MQQIVIRGARTHNLRNVDLDLPRDKLIVVTGLSGSGKSSLAFDTVYAEGQRRYVESLSAYARQFLSVMEKPDADRIEGLSPAISIEQKSTSHNPRSTVGTITEIHDYLRLLFARAGEPRCPVHGLTLQAQTVSQMVDQVLELPESTRLMLLAPVVEARKGEHVQLIEGLRRQGYLRVRVDGEVHEIDLLPPLERRKRHTIEAVVDRFRVREGLELRLAESLETALALSSGRVRVVRMDEAKGEELVFSARFACPVCDYSLPSLEPRAFSFNNPAGACPACDGLGTRSFFDPRRMVAHPELSLPGGAIPGWDRRNIYYFQMLESLARHYDFDLDLPFNALPEAVQAVVLNGSGKEEIEFVHRQESGRTYRKRRTFEGIIPNIERRYRETQSAAVREELSKFLGTRPCDECGGARLNLPARNVFVGDLTSARAERAAGGQGDAHARAAESGRGAGRDRERHPQGNRTASAIPGRCRPGLPRAGPPRRDPVGRRGAAHSAREPDRRGAGRRHVRPGRALHRSSPARQPPPARYAGAPARHRQYPHRGRARRRGDPKRGPRGRHGTGRRPARRQGSGAGDSP